MSRVLFAKGDKANLPTSGQEPYKIFFTLDTKEIYMADVSGVPQKYSDVEIVVGALPTVGVEGRVYINDVSGDISVKIYYNGTWIDLSSGGLDIDTFELVFGLKSKTDTFGYNGNDVISMTRVYDDGTDAETVSYGYDADGNIISETRQMLGKNISNSFSYDINGNITEVRTIVTDI